MPSQESHCNVKSSSSVMESNGTLSTSNYANGDDVKRTTTTSSINTANDAKSWLRSTVNHRDYYFGDFDDTDPKMVMMMKPKVLNGTVPGPRQLLSKAKSKLADLREQARVENLALKSNAQDDHKQIKNLVGGWALSPEQLAYLKRTPYEYNASAGSFLELLFLQRFWTWLAQFIPARVAPCTITAIGFAINLVTCCILISYSPEARSEVPRWSLLLCALGVFLYQIADALDGKQCYKVQNTQIEEFYDHGCDSVSTILLVYSVAIATKVGQWPPLFLTVMFASLIAFYSTHWLGFITKQMVFGRIDVSEGQWAMITIHLLSALFGQSIWSTQIALPFLGISVTAAQVLTLLSLGTFLSAILGNTGIVLFHVQTPLEKAGVRIPRKKTSSIKPILPVLLLTGLTVGAYQMGYYHINPVLYVFTFGLTYSKLTMKLVIAHCTDSEMELTDPALAAPILLVLKNLLLPASTLTMESALICGLICNSIELIRYFTCISWDFRVALDVWIFQIRYPADHPKSRRHCGGFYINGLNNQEVLKRQSPQ